MTACGRHLVHYTPVKRVGHKGADNLATGNTIASFEAARKVGVDMIEFDVLPLADGRLVLAHDYADAARRELLTLEQGLDHLAGSAYDGIELDIDMKLPGYEAAVVSALTCRGLNQRSVVSSAYLESLDRVGNLACGVCRGLAVPHLRRDWGRWQRTPLARAVISYWRLRLPWRVQRLLRDGRFEAVMAHRTLLSPRLVDAVKQVGGQLYVWTVDDGYEIGRLQALGVDAVITNDPRLFAGAVDVA